MYVKKWFFVKWGTIFGASLMMGSLMGTGFSGYGSLVSGIAFGFSALVTGVGAWWCFAQGGGVDTHDFVPDSLCDETMSERTEEQS